MKILDKIKKLFRRKGKSDLRAKCVAAYGEEFGEIYDTLNSGGAIGGFLETACVLSMIEDIKEGRYENLQGNQEVS